MKTISLQRWIYVSGDSVANTLRALATEIEKIESRDITISADEYINDFSYSTIEISYYEEDSDCVEPFRAGICMSWKIED